MSSPHRWGKARGLKMTIMFSKMNLTLAPPAASSPPLFFSSLLPDGGALPLLSSFSHPQGAVVFLFSFSLPPNAAFPALFSSFLPPGPVWRPLALQFHTTQQNGHSDDFVSVWYQTISILQTNLYFTPVTLLIMTRCVTQVWHIHLNVQQ